MPHFLFYFAVSISIPVLFIHMPMRTGGAGIDARHIVGYRLLELGIVMDQMFLTTGLFGACLLQYILPKRYRVYVLLFASVLFFICVSPPALIYVTGVTAVSYVAGRALEKRRSKWIVGAVTAAMVILFIGIKYSIFWCGTSLIIPMGLSYYSLMVIGYLMEVYRGTVPAEQDFARYALFVSFFPQVVAGPIGRYKELRRQYEEGPSFDLTEIRAGVVMVLVGFFQKMVLADNLLVLVRGICEGEFVGISVVFAMLLYSLVIYFDFGGYSLIAIGGAKMLGVRLMDNFNAPYRAVSIQEFWRRWHISLSSWFRDYVYIPFGGSRNGERRRDANTMLVFILSGAWHGSLAGYLLWGGIHGCYLVAGKRTKAFRDRLFARARQKERFAWLQRTAVYVLVSVAWVPFFAGKLWKTRDLFLRMFAFCPWTMTDGSLMELGLNGPMMVVCALGTIFMFAIDHYNQKADFYRSIAKDHAWIRYGFCILMFCAIILAGAYGTQYYATEFIYGQF